MSNQDFSFTFDTMGFNASLGIMKKSLVTFAGNAEKIVSGISKVFSAIPSSLSLFPKAIAGASKGLHYLFGSVKQGIDWVGSQVTKFAPEVSQAFGLAADIIGKNFFAPLRREMVPYLQKMLNWVKEHRKDFVQFGSVLVNVFRTVKISLETIWKLFEPIRAVIRGVINEIFGTSAKSLTETVNLILFKMTVIAIGLRTILAPVFEDIANIISNVIGMFADLGEGFMKAFDTATLNRLWQSIKNLFAAFSTENTSSAMKFLGWLAGQTFNVLIEALSRIVDLMTSIVEMDAGKIGQSLLGIMVGKYNSANLTGTIDEIEKYRKAIKSSKFAWAKMGAEGAGLQKKYSSAESANDYSGMLKILKDFAAEKGLPVNDVNDAIITKDGKVIHTAPNDNIIATKSDPGGMGGKTVNINVGGMTLNVTEGNAEQAGGHFIDGLSQQIRNLLMDDRMRAGVL